MKVLFIGGTGLISSAVSREAIDRGLDLYLLNRGLRAEPPPGSHCLTADISQTAEVRAILEGFKFDAVVNWIAYTPNDIERDLSLFRGRVKQYIFISSASTYQKPPTSYLVTEATPLGNPFWEYAQNKIACEERLWRAYRDEGFPGTIVRPSHTYQFNFPVAIGGGQSYTLADRMLKGLPVIVHGDGTSLWVLTHAEDFARGFLGLLGNTETVGQAFQITSDEVLSWRQIYETIADALGVEARMVHFPSHIIAQVAPRLAGTLLGDKMWSVVFDNSKIKKYVPGFQAVISFREGIQRTLDWFQADSSRRRADEALNQEMDQIIESSHKLTSSN